ncbi:MAG: PTS glucose transporter subunit IIA [Clostridiales bacterium]|nr:PTS glucose transporter subunit IIA [Clostridiales bacterium]
MGFFSKFKKQEAPKPVCDPMTVYAPAAGTVIPLADFPDALFSQEVMGPGCGIQPSGDVVVAPFNGTVTHVIDTLHAVGVTSDSGMEMVIHIGVDTVAMNGKGFRSEVKNGQAITMGQPLIHFDSNAIKDAGYPDAIAVIVTNGGAYQTVERIASGEVTPGEPLLKIRE